MSFVICTVTGLSFETSPFVAIARGVDALVAFDCSGKNAALDAQAVPQSALHEPPNQSADPASIFNAVVNEGASTFVDNLEAFLDLQGAGEAGFPTDRGAFIVVNDFDVSVNPEVTRDEPGQADNGARRHQPISEAIERMP